MEHVALVLFRLLLTFLGYVARSARRRARRLFKNHWPEVPATIEIVSVAKLPQPAEFVTVYLAMLTYFYRNPDLQTGDYEVEFSSELQAKRWANYFKGLQVRVRVNPGNPEDSVLMQLPISVSPKTPVTFVAQKRIAHPLPVKIRALSPQMKSWLELYRLVCIAGLVASLVVLGISIVSGGHARSQALFLIGGCLLAIVFISLGIISTKTTGSLKNVPRFYARRCSRRSIWTVVLSTSILVLLTLYAFDRAQIPIEARAVIAVHLPYVFASWSFLISWIFFTELDRAQRSLMSTQESQLQTI